MGVPFVADLAPSAAPAIHAWPTTLFPGLKQLAAAPAALLCLMLALNALVHPYLGLDHDARLYAVQVSERAHPGLYGDDLYLQFGSQDRYSAFSLLMMPLVALCGRTTSFFLVYLLSKSLLFWGALRLIRALVFDLEAVALGALFLAVVPGPFGGNEIFNVNESFLTPRLLGSALVLFALERLLAGRLFVSLALLVGAFALHAVMALGGALTWGFFLLSRQCRLRDLVLLGVVAIGAGVVAIVYEPLGNFLFKPVDDEWRDIVLRTCFFIRPSLWLASDWLRIGWGIAVTIVAALSFARTGGRLLWSALLAGVVGFAGTALGVQQHYLLFLQTSPYRTMWLFEFLAVPLGIAWAFALCRHSSTSLRCAGLALLAFTTLDWTTPPVWGLPSAEPIVLVFLGVFLVCLVCTRGLARHAQRPDWCDFSTGAGFRVALVAMGLYDLMILFALCVPRPDAIPALDLHPVRLAHNVPRLLFKLPLILLVLWGIRGATAASIRPRFSVAVLAFILGYQTLLVGLSASEWYGRRFSSTSRESTFVGTYLDDRPNGRSVTVYWPGDLRQVWFDVGSRSYFNTMQMSGCVFNRGTATEGRRRSQLVRRFEAAFLARRPPVDTWWREALANFYELETDEPVPTRADLLKLCADPAVDVVVLEHEFDGLDAVTDGKLYIYDCRVIRSQMASGRR